MQNGLVWFFSDQKGYPKHLSLEPVWMFPPVIYIKFVRQWFDLHETKLGSKSKGENPNGHGGRFGFVCGGIAAMYMQ